MPLCSDAFSRFTAHFVDFDKDAYERAHAAAVTELLALKDALSLAVRLASLPVPVSRLFSCGN